MGKVGLAPAALPNLHADLARFLRTQDIDDKARLGKVFAVRALAEAAEAPVLEEAKAPEDPDLGACASAASGDVVAAQVATLTLDPPEGADGSMDDYLDELLGDE